MNALNWWKVTVKTFTVLQNIFISNKIAILKILKKYGHGFNKNIKKKYKTVFNNDNKMKCFLKRKSAY